jgi:hypothetical protein
MALAIFSLCALYFSVFMGCLYGMVVVDLVRSVSIHRCDVTFSLPNRHAMFNRSTTDVNLFLGEVRKMKAVREFVAVVEYTAGPLASLKAVPLGRCYRTKKACPPA